MTSNRVCILLIPILALLYFHDLVRHPDQVLYSEHSDLLALHVPSKYFLIRSWQESGEIPLWCPYSFSGLPFVHDTQVSAFYPPHLPLYWLQPEHVGAALSWLVLFHVIAAGWCMYAYARGQELQPSAALVSATGYMFAGKWLIHVLKVGHYNMLPLAWLPLLLLLMEGAVRRGSLLRATGAGVVFALFVLCAYPYITLYVGLFVGLWSLGSALECAGFLGGNGECTRSRTVKALGTWLGVGAWVALLGAALGAIQLLPALEAAPHATRSLGVEPSLQMLRGGTQSLVMLAGPPLTDERTWDYEGGLGILWLVLAALAPMLANGQSRFRAIVAVLLLVYVLGGALPMQYLPGFRFFRLPSRALLLLSFPVALLAGVSVQALTSGLAAEVRKKSFIQALKICFAVIFVQFGYALLRWSQGEPFHFHLYWILLPITLTMAAWLFQRSSDWPHARWAWCVVLLADLWLVTWGCAEVKPWGNIYTPSACIKELSRLNARNPGRIVDRGPPKSNRSPLWPALPELLELESVGGFNPTDIRRYKEYLQFITNVDEPLKPPPNGNFTSPVLETFPIVNKSLLDLLGVRYLLQPSNLTLKVGGEEELANDPRWREAVRDPAPTSFDFDDGGFQILPPYTLYENREAFERVFVVHESAPLPESAMVLPALRNTDFRKKVLLEGPGIDDSIEQPTGEGALRQASIREYGPNRVVVDVGPGKPGWLVLADVWFPVWTCTVNGAPEEVRRANYLFRAVPVSEEAREVVFTFAPVSYSRGKFVSLTALAAVSFFFLLGLLAGRRDARNA